MSADWRDERLTLSDGRVLAFRDCGAAGAPALLYCHGFPGSRLEQEDPLAVGSSRGLRVLVPDRPGYGGSDPCPGRTVRAWAADVRELVDHLGIARLRVLGFSGGGAYALALAAVHPEAVERVALVSAMGPVAEPAFQQSVPEATRQFFALARSSPAELRRQLGTLLPDGPTLFAFMLEGMAPSDLQTMSQPASRASYERSLTLALTQGVEGIVGDAAALGSRWGFALEQVDRPVDIWQGEVDVRVSPATALQLEHDLPQGHLRRWSGTGHFPDNRDWAAVLARLSQPD